MTALCHIRVIWTFSQEDFDNPGSHLPFAHDGTVSLLPRKLNFIHYILLPWTSLWTEKHWTLFKSCANNKSEVINECVHLAAVRQPFCPTEWSLVSGANFLKVVKSNAAMKMFQPRPETIFVSSSPFFSMTSFYCEFAVVSMQQELQNKCFLLSLCKSWTLFLWKARLQLLEENSFLKVPTRLVKTRAPCWPDAVLNLYCTVRLRNQMLWLSLPVTSGLFCVPLHMKPPHTSSICTDCSSAI